MEKKGVLNYAYVNLSWWNDYLRLVQSVKKSKDEIAQGKFKKFTAKELIEFIHS